MKHAPLLFTKVCGCINHDIFVGSVDATYQLRSRSFFINRGEYNELLERKLIDRRVSYLCTVCLDFVRKKLNVKHSLVAKKAQHNINDDIADITDSDVDTTGYHNGESNGDSTFINEDEQADGDNRTTSDISGSQSISDEANFVIDVGSLDIANYRTLDTELAPSPSFTAETTSLESKLKYITSDISKLDWNDLGDSMKEALCTLSSTLGNLIKGDLDRDKHEMAKECHDFNSLLAIEPREWYHNRNTLLTSFLTGCTGVSLSTNKDKKFNSCLHAIEQVIYTKNNNVVTPFALKRNIIMYSISKSKLSSTIFGSWEGSGSYTKVNEILNSPTDPLTVPSEADVVITFDNEQKVGKHSGRIKEASKQPISIITTVAVIKPNPPTTYQFSPFNRLNYNHVQVVDAVNVMENYYRDIMRVYRSRFVSEMISSVLEEQFEDMGEIRDYIDTAVSHEGKYICSCRYMKNSLYDICPSCKVNNSYYEHGFDKYFHTKSLHSYEPTITYAEPCMVNPTGFTNVLTVLKQIREQAITSTRCWTTVTCDGVPYKSVSDIQDEWTECSKCHDVFRKDEQENHKQLHDAEVDFVRPFSELIVRPGAGHIEINMARKLLKFLWIPMMKDLSGYFGFQTVKSKAVFEAGVDHHRSREVLETVLFALAKELVVPYVRHCMDINDVPTSSGYLEWHEQKVVSQNYSFIYHATFSYLLAFSLFNEAVRKNNSDNMMAARTSFHPLFFVGHHPMYQKLHLRDMFERVNYPDQIAAYLKLTESFTKSGKPYGLGADFIHEEVNRDIKSFLPKAGTPSKETWLNIIRKMDQLKAMKSSLLASSGVTQKSGKKRPKNFHHEITMVRREFRKDGYLLNYNEEQSLRSIDGQYLDHSLCDFNFVIKENYDLYKKEYKLNGTFGSDQLAPVFITNEERIEFNKIESKTVAEIKRKIEDIAKAMPDKGISSYVLDELKRKKYRKKHELVSMYKENEKLLAEQLAETLIQEDQEQ